MAEWEKNSHCIKISSAGYNTINIAVEVQKVYQFSERKVQMSISNLLCFLRRFLAQRA
jgi:hypothetical protein